MVCVNFDIGEILIVKYLIFVLGVGVVNLFVFVLFLFCFVRG